MTSTDICSAYKRVTFDDIPIYIHPEYPDWFVPGAQTDRLIRCVGEGNPVETACRLCAGDRDLSPLFLAKSLDLLCARLNHRATVEYTGRAGHHSLDKLKECWIHITNQCNMACTHCMFSSTPGNTEASLSHERVIAAIDQAYGLGARIFYFTGGEPFVYPGFTGICDRILALDDTHVVVLTNGKKISAFDTWLRATPSGKVHFQVSLDGCRENHERIRGKGSFDQVVSSLKYLTGLQLPVTVSMAVTAVTAADMSSIVTIAGEAGVGAVHYMWPFFRGRARKDGHVSPACLLKNLIAADSVARGTGCVIDNIEVIKSQVFTIPGTRHDLSNAAWQSLAVGPSGKIYPSPALVGFDYACGGVLEDGLESVWRDSGIFNTIRSATVRDCGPLQDDPLKYIIGGGDIDHSMHAGNEPSGSDPYIELYNGIALYLIADAARQFQAGNKPGLLCRMGEFIYECTEDSRPVNFTHSNCVQSISGTDGHALVKKFYSRAAEEVNEDIVNPVTYSGDEIDHIPAESRVRSYGCGSPVREAGLVEGESLLDLGCGAGVECFIAAKHVGPQGHVTGIDMADPMLDRAERARKQVAQTLGYDIVRFKKGFLETLPMKPDWVDCIISNCVINLTADKRRTFREAGRVLKPGGRLCISDIVCDRDIPLEMKYNAVLRGECIGGALREPELFAMLDELGFVDIYINKRYLYRRVENIPFFAITYTAYKPAMQTKESTLLYRGPFPGVIHEDGTLLRRGEAVSLRVSPSFTPDSSFFELDNEGNVVNIDQTTACGVFVAPGSEAAGVKAAPDETHSSGCCVCGADLVYTSENILRTCYFCGKESRADAQCVNNHFVCDGCHAAGSLEIVRTLCCSSTETDMLTLFNRIREHPSIPLHGPEHHGLVPGVVLAAYRNSGGAITENEILTGIERGSSIAGGACAFLGVCGGASGIGTAFSIILKGTPYKADVRQIVQNVTARILGTISALKAPRCCCRDGYIALREAAVLSKEYLPVQLTAQDIIPCRQHHLNKECIRSACPLWPDRTA
ncbi:MAG: methyltransferase domain-containing protein [Chitinivibrionales bacterium]|nr:methyltransferase domain-containing protein [Chitinivibrionales bacterium]